MRSPRSRRSWAGYTYDESYTYYDIAELKEVRFRHRHVACYLVITPARHKELIYAVYGYYCGTGEAVETAMP